MAKEKERKTARRLYVELGMTGKEIATELDVTEKTVSAWVNKYGWKSELIARNTSSVKQIENIKDIMSGMAAERLELSAKLKNSIANEKPEESEEIRKQIAKIDDAISKWNKTLTNIDKENRISLSVYIAVMEQIFEAMLRYDAALHAKTIDFQELHLRTVRINLK